MALMIFVKNFIKTKPKSGNEKWAFWGKKGFAKWGNYINEKNKFINLEKKGNF